MLDLGSSFVASAARDPNAIALVDGDLRLTYRQWYEKICALVASFVQDSMIRAMAERKPGATAL